MRRPLRRAHPSRRAEMRRRPCDDLFDLKACGLFFVDYASQKPAFSAMNRGHVDATHQQMLVNVVDVRFLLGENKNAEGEKSECQTQSFNEPRRRFL